jgi:hypothetical protein
VSNATSKSYAIVGHRRSLVDSYRALALNFPLALWLLRLIKGQREATVNDMLDVVTTIDRAQGTAAISQSANLMARSHALERLITWYVL